jgi:tetratricopeptide (TPR) repeat protein
MKTKSLDPAILNHKANDLLEKGKYTEAIKIYDTLLKSELSQNVAATVLHNKSVALGFLGRTDEAKKCQEMAEKLGYYPHPHVSGSG